MTRFEARTIARIAYRDVMQVMEKYDDSSYIDILFHWMSFPFPPNT